jgi:large subunit ribosomal protein L23
MNNKDLTYSILKKPLFTEKSSGQQERFNTYSFVVAPWATKVQVRQAVESLFGVHVTKVNTQNVPGKVKRLAGVQGRTSGWKKALVTLKEGEAIELA